MSEELGPEAPAKRKDDDDHRVFRFDGTVSLGHLITLLTLLSTILIWNIRLEDRVNNEIDLRARLELRVDQGIAHLDSQIVDSARAAADRSKEIRDDVKHLADSITTMLLSGQHASAR